MFVITQGFLGPLAITQGYSSGASRPSRNPMQYEGGGAYPRDRERIRRPRRSADTDSDDMAAIALALEVLGVFD